MKKILFNLVLLATVLSASSQTVTSLFDFTDDGTPGNTKNAASFAYHENIAYVLYVDNNVVNDSIYPGKICSYNLDTGEVIRSSFEFPTLVTNTASSDEGHNQSAIAVDGNGRIHVWIGMHNHKMKYWRSDTPEDITNFTDKSSDMPGYGDSGEYTDLPEGNDNDAKLYSYPYAATTTNGDVFVIVRRTAHHTQTHERQDLYHWDNSKNTWSMDLVGKQHGKNAYMSTLFADNSNNLHIVTAWSKLHSGDNTFQKGTYMRYDVNEDKYFKADGTEVSVPMSVDGTDADRFYAGEWNEWDPDINEWVTWNDTVSEIQTPRVTLNSQGQPVVMYPYNRNNYSQTDPKYNVNIARWSGSGWTHTDSIIPKGVKNHYRPPISFTGGLVNVYARDVDNAGVLTYSDNDGATFDTIVPLTGGGNTPVQVLNYSPDTDLYINKRYLYKVVYPQSNPNNKPVVILNTPKPNEVFDEGSTISMTAEAFDGDGSIDKVQFYLIKDNEISLLATDTSAPYSYNWDIPADSIGAYTIRAKAFDNLGATKTYANDITVNALPTVTLTYPANGIQLDIVEGDIVSITADANDSDGSITQVEFFDNGNLLYIDTDPPYNYDWTATTGAHNISAKATDDSGATQTNANDIVVNFKPVVALTSPENGDQFNEGTTISIIADANDSDGSITKVEFYDNDGTTNTLIHTDTTAPYSYSWNGASAGTHTIRAKAFDDLGATKTYARDITVNINIAINNNPLYFSDETNNHHASMAVDNDINTYWESKFYPQWIELDFGSDKSIRSSELVCLNDRAYQFTIEAKPDGGSYSTIVDRSNNTTPGTVAAPIADTFSTTARYVKLTITGASGYSGPWIDITEFRIFGTDISASKSSSSKKNTQNLALDASIKIFPNPTRDYLKVRFDDNQFGNDAKYSIYNLQGQIMTSNLLSTKNKINENTIQFNVTNLATGMYFLSIKDRKNNMQLKFYKD
ncbi:Ig-like domain-containing protein [Aestuariivivens insulae]|uniref:Ig-like domain-containing protein n=1 Tax=Aestuariivivens insulae TaxID=1621988 RepID=UPI001F5874AC|nr:Ig-like domain-containing protein [Aestuariivivens insulae]